MEHKHFAFAILVLLGAEFHAHSATQNPIVSTLAGKKCEIYEGSLEISHVRAVDDSMVFACFGYLHGRDRAWQMDYLRRTYQGRRAEILDKNLLKSDFLMRLLGFSEHAQRLFKEMSSQQKNQLWAYTAGANRGFQEAIAKGVYELRTLKYDLEPWTPVDTIGLILLQAFDQTRKSFEEDLREEERVNRHAGLASSLFSPDGLPWDVSILKSAEIRGGRRSQRGEPRKGDQEEHLLFEMGSRKSLDGELLSDPVFGEEGGSNNWALSPKRSKTEHAWFANDPHLSLKHPPFWYQLNLTSPQGDVIGVSLPGIPAIVSGANRHAAWGLTNSHIDVADVAFIDEGELKDSISERPWIWFKWGMIRLPMFFKRFRRTRQGWPILPLPAPKGKAIVLRWSGFDLHASDLEGLHRLMYGTTVRELDQIFSKIGVPSWNFTFADTQGKIGFRMVGKVPKRFPSSSYGIPAMSLNELARWEYLQIEDLPHLMNPGRGFIVTANNRHWPAGYIHSGGRTHPHGFRGYRIEELLQSEPKHDLASIQKVQCDVQAVDARFLAPKMIQALLQYRKVSKSPFEDFEIQGIHEMENWNFSTDVNCKACALYRRWAEGIYQSQGLNEIGLYRLLGKSPLPTDFEKELDATFRQALAEFRIDVGAKFPNWGEVHRSDFEHLAGGEWFPGSSIPTPGDQASVSPGSSRWGEGIFHHHSGPSQRLVVELTSPPIVWNGLAGSNRDREGPDLAHLKGPWMKWARCELDRLEFPIDWSKVPKHEIQF